MLLSWFYVAKYRYYGYFWVVFLRYSHDKTTTMIITLALKKTEVNKSGKCNIKIRISHNYGTRYISTDFYIHPEFMSNGILSPKYPGYKYLQVELDSKCLEYQKKLLGINYDDMHINRIVEYLTEKTEKTDFIAYFKKIVAAKTAINERTGNIYRATQAKIEKYELRRPIMFSDINAGWLSKFQDEMKAKGLKPNASSIHFRNIRAVINDAIDNNVIPLESYPFRRFKFKGAKTQKRAISIETLIKIRDFETSVKMIDHARNVFMLSFYLIGTNLTDLYQLETINEGRVEFARAKTHRPYSIKIEPEAAELIQKLIGGTRLLNLSEKHTSTLRMIQQVNRGLNLIVPGITSYSARHTWSTIASNQLSASDDDIGQSLGHTKKTVTDTYIDRDPAIVDKLNRQVIDLLKSKNEIIDEGYGI